MKPVGILNIVRFDVNVKPRFCKENHSTNRQSSIESHNVNWKKPNVYNFFDVCNLLKDFSVIFFVPLVSSLLIFFLVVRVIFQILG